MSPPQTKEHQGQKPDQDTNDPASVSLNSNKAIVTLELENIVSQQHADDVAEPREHGAESIEETRLCECQAILLFSVDFRLEEEY